MNQLVSIKMWEVFAEIHSKICIKRLKITFFADPMTVLMKCDESLALNQQH